MEDCNLQLYVSNQAKPIQNIHLNQKENKIQKRKTNRYTYIKHIKQKNNQEIYKENYIYIHITHIYNNIYTFDFVLLFLK